jgi:DNA polymerase III subunit epsilon
VIGALKVVVAGGPNVNFVAIDVETANADLASVCQIGLVRFLNGQVAERWESLVNPEDYFDSMNVGIHGIDEAAIADAPTFPALSSFLSKQLVGTVVASHTPFDRVAIGALFAKYGVAPPEITWLDTARVVRRTWLDLSRRGYGLSNVAARLGIQFRHHNAVEDARAAGEILVRAIDESGLSLEEWLLRVEWPIQATQHGRMSEQITRDGNPEGPLYGEVAVFTGALSQPRREAADLAARAGCEVAASVTQATTLLIVGDQDVCKLAGHEKSSKQRKAEQLISKGHQIRLLRESDFRSLIAIAERNG